MSQKMHNKTSKEGGDKKKVEDDEDSERNVY